MIRYNPSKIEPKWQKIWEKRRIYKTPERPKKENKAYILGMFPYPSGEGLHVGHVRIYTAVDVVTRYFRMKGKEVLNPIGWDAFGLPAENAAIREKKNPNDMVPKNEANFKRQCQMLGFSYDWEREFSTTNPSYYKWTQWLFLKLYSVKNEKGERLIYRKKVPINWCPSCKTGLADEEVLPDGTHERCGTPVTKKDMPQWLFRITDFADRLLEDLPGLDWPEGILEMERNWIGRSDGTLIRFPIQGYKDTEIKRAKQESYDIGVSSEAVYPYIDVFTTRPDTLFGTTFLVLAPEHPILKNSKFQIPNSKKKEVLDYIEATKQKSELARIAEIKEKTGVFTGLYVINPLSGGKIPVWVADFVLMSYGTGAVMGVPGHDQRDWEFAKKYNLPIKIVIQRVRPSSPREAWGSEGRKGRTLTEAFEDYGILVNSGKYTGLHSKEAIAKITKDLEEKGVGKKDVRYHLRDWIFSRQRYWGEPIPIIYCRKCWEVQSSRQKGGQAPFKVQSVDGRDYAVVNGEKWAIVPVPEDDLPVKLPYVEHYEPTGTGESPLVAISDWVNTKCPRCGGPARRETDTMPNWAGSCWYFLRFCDPKNNKAPFKKELVDFWHPVDWYLGGAEHAVLHLLYARFWVKAFYDLGLVSFKEPFYRLRSVGMVLGEDGRKMSKSFENIVNPDEVVQYFGADTLRIYEMFMGPWGQTIVWNTKAVSGARRFLDKVWRLVEAERRRYQAEERGKNISVNLRHHPRRSASTGEGRDELTRALHRLIKKVGEDIEAMKFNTAIASMMTFVNDWQSSNNRLAVSEVKIFLRLLAPFAPHITEELWQQLNSRKNAENNAEKRGKQIGVNQRLDQRKSAFVSIHQQPWPEYDPKLVKEETVTIVVQIDGKLREKLNVGVGESRENLRNLALRSEKIKKHLSAKKIKDIVFIKDRLINFVTGS